MLFYLRFISDRNRCFPPLIRKVMRVVSICNTKFVYCRELAPGTVSLTGDWVRDDGSKQNSYYIAILCT